MSKPIFNLFLAAGVLSVLATTVQAQATSDDVASLIAGGNVSVGMRLRHESVVQDNTLRDAEANTLRTRVTLNTGSVHGFTALLELDNVLSMGGGHYDSFVRDRYRGNYSVIADPVGSEVNQALVSYEQDGRHFITVGRQRIVHDNQRFIGGVAWRQNEQTYDSATYRFGTGSGEFAYSYLWNVNRIFGTSKDSVQLTDLDSDSHLFSGFRQFDWGKLSGYLYALDFSEAAAMSTLTLGLKYKGQVGPVALTAGVAQQVDHGDNPLSYNATFVELDGAIQAGPVTLQLGYELLGSDNGRKAFQTPLATLHAFQGWADMFLATPSEGIEDRYVSVSGKVKGVALAATYHDFQAGEGGADYGGEVDLIATYPFSSRISLQAKYASYDEDGYAVDTDKFWFTVNLAF